METVRFALFGCGKIAVKHAAALRQITHARLVAVCDVDAVMARTVATRFEVPSYSDLDGLLAQHEVDVVCVLTPSGLHAAHAIQVAQTKKHVVVEKPMALTLDDADAMIRACDEHGVKLFVVKQNRYNEAVVGLKRALVDERFGKLVLGAVRLRWCRKQEYYDQAGWRGTWAMDGGVLANQASHHIDLLEWMMGPVDSVMAKISTRLSNIEVEDTGLAMFQFRNGALGVVEATTATRPRDLEGSISVLGERGSVELGGFAADRVKHWEFSIPTPEDDAMRQGGGPQRSAEQQFAHGHAMYLQGVVESIRNHTKALVDGIEGRKSLELINAIYESAETGREVHLRFKPRLCRLGQK
ncbi:MAG: Gfo/Idh/MocA family oxidoreductase [Deltaproteobacteria bacterium]|nr:Gfo/Idh/MocA family oxidoreductase [Deltaproteobacteria bacterium]